MQVIVNGTKINIPGAHSISMINGKTFVDGKPLSHFSDGASDEELYRGKEINIVIEGDISGSLTVDECESIQVKGSVGGDVEGGNSVKIGGAVKGDVQAGNSVECGDVEGDVRAGNTVRSGNIRGSARAGNNIFRG